MGDRIFHKIIYTDSSESTNSDLLTSSYEDKTILYTFNQTKGRGRLDRSWENFKDKNVALSAVFLEPEINPVWLTAVFSVSLVECLMKYGLNDCWIKWPNDVFVKDCKISGILTESQWYNGRIIKSVTGIGINVNSDKNDLISIERPVTSIYKEIEKKIDLNDFIINYIEMLEKYFKINYNPVMAGIKEKWMEYSRVIGRNASLTEITKGSTPVFGTVSHIDDDGYLYFNDGKSVFKVITGDINIL